MSTPVVPLHLSQQDLHRSCLSSVHKYIVSAIQWRQLYKTEEETQDPVLLWLRALLPGLLAPGVESDLTVENDPTKWTANVGSQEEARENCLMAISESLGLAAVGHSIQESEVLERLRRIWEEVLKEDWQAQE